MIGRVAVAALVAAALAAPAQAARLVQVGSFDAPVSVASRPGDEHRVYVVEQGGTIRELIDGVEQAAPFLDIGDEVVSGGERGLLSMAFDPADLTHVYVYFTSEPDGDVAIERYTAPTPDGAEESTGIRILTIQHRLETNHNGGQLQFGPDGRLYAGTGDGGGGGDQHHNAQYLGPPDDTEEHNALLGKLLRMNPDGSAPAGNPFAGDAALVWSLGLRNPWRFSFDRLTGDLVVGDVGQGAWEEIDFAAAPDAGRGLNFGWNLREGMHDGPGTDPLQPAAPALTEPVIEHSHADGWFAIIGGYVVRDPSLPELAARYVYGDNAEGELYAASLSSAGASGDGPLGLSVPQLAGFGEDAMGRVYAASLAGPVYRLETTGGGQPPPGGPGTGTPPPGTDATAPRITLRVRRRQHPRRIRARVSCDERCSLRVKVRRAKARRVTAAAGATVKVTMRPSRRARRAWRRALRHGHRVVLRVRARATDATGNTARASRRVRIVR